MYSSTSPQAVDYIHSALDWLEDDQASADAGMAGLHFGDAGVTVAFAEAARSGFITQSRALTFARRHLTAPCDWLDVTHGAAGQALAALSCTRLLGPDPIFRNVLGEAARHLVTTQNSDGAWITPDGVAGMSGDILTGFAHGVAGCGYALAQVAMATKDAEASAAAEAAGDWLLRTAARDGNSIAWAYSVQEPNRWSWWCHGAPGIGLTLAALYTLTGRGRYADAARATITDPESAHSNLSQCHGTSGLLEAAIDVHRALDTTSRPAYSRLTQCLLSMARETRGHGLT
ncbi:hypothetical protein GCM10022235_00780 [Kribbella ginsengisoli]|uniref:Uncharacterized protein n=2 Tax=Kribbella ginsengisoli TaxID=363865 RepID=A0ABP6VK37_9ACTN